MQWWAEFGSEENYNTFQTIINSRDKMDNLEFSFLNNGLMLYIFTFAWSPNRHSLKGKETES